MLDECDLMDIEELDTNSNNKATQTLEMGDLIAAMEKKIINLELQISDERKKSHKWRTELMKLKVKLGKFFSQDQIKSMCGKKVIWSTKTIQKALILKYKLGKQFYDKSFIKKYAPFPSNATLMRKIHKFKITPGTCKINVKILAAKMEKIPINRRSMGLVFDEKAIIPSSQTDGNSPHYNGITTLLPSKTIRERAAGKKEEKGEEVTEIKVRAKNALVVLAAGTYVREKEIVGLHYTAGCTDGKAMKEFIFSLIKDVEDMANVEIDWLCFDIGPSNNSFLNACGVSNSFANEKFFIQHPNRTDQKLFLFPDNTHCKKNLISALRRNEFKFQPQLVDFFNLNSNIVTFEDVKHIFNIQSEMQLKPARKLKQENIKPNHFQVMNEQVAYGVFSSDVWNAIKFTDKDAEKRGKMNATAAFLQIIFIFHSITKNKCGWSKDDWQKYEDEVEFLQWFIDAFLPGLETPTTLFCIPAMKMAIRSLIVVSKIYFDSGYEKVMPSWFLSDAIENIFSMVTAIFKKPTATTIAQALRIISINRFDFEPVTVMYSWDKTESMKIDYLKLLSEIINEEIEKNDESVDDCEIPQIINTDEVTYGDLFQTELENNVFFLRDGKNTHKSCQKSRL